MKTSLYLSLAASVAMAGFASAAPAASAAPTTPTATAASAAPETDWTDAIKKALVVYENKDTFVRKVRFAWMEQFQVGIVQPNGSNGLHLRPGASPVNQEFRRSWVGVNIDFASGTEFHTWARIGGLPERWTYSNGHTKRNFTYTDLFDIWLKQDILPVKGLSVKAGKLKPLFTTDYSTPSSAIVCIERSILANQFAMDSNWGLDITYAPNKQNKVYLQLMANDRASASKSLTHRDVYRDGRGLKGEFGWEDKCYSIIGASHKFDVTANGYQQISGQYMHDFNNAYHNRRKKGANCYGLGFKDALSLGYEIKQGQLTFMANLVAAFESQSSDGSKNIGLQLQPVYTVNPHVDLIFRYTGMMGDKACRLAADRYICTQNTPASAPTWADSLHSFYFGVDLYASARNRNAAKLMFGAEYLTARAEGQDCYNGWEFTTAARWNF